MMIRGAGRRLNFIQPRFHGQAALSIQAAAQKDSSASVKSSTDVPGPKPYPVIGMLPMFMNYFDKKAQASRMDDLFMDLHKQYGDLVSFGDGHNEMFAIYDEEILNIIATEGKYPSGILASSWAIHTFNETQNVTVKNPFLYNGDVWRDGRMEVNPYLFNSKTAKSYLNSINQASGEAVHYVENFADNMEEFAQFASIDMFMAIALGLQMNACKGDVRGREFSTFAINTLAKVGHIGQRVPWARYSVGRALSPSWKGFVNDWSSFGAQTAAMVDEALAETAEEKWGFIQRFVHGSENITKEACYEMVMVLLLAGSDTTTSVLLNSICNIADNPEVQERLHKELKQELKGADYQPDANLKYLEQVLKETQRYSPALPWVVVKGDIANDVVLHNYLIKKGSTVFFNLSKIMSSEEYSGPEPLKFNPDRWSEERIEARKGTKAAFLDHPIVREPFGFGARSCVGQRVAKLEIKSLLSRLFQDYHLEIDRERTKPSTRLTKTTTQLYPCPIFKITKRN